MVRRISLGPRKKKKDPLDEHENKEEENMVKSKEQYPKLDFIRGNIISSANMVAEKEQLPEVTNKTMATEYGKNIPSLSKESVDKTSKVNISKE